MVDLFKFLWPSQNNSTLNKLIFFPRLGVILRKDIGVGPESGNFPLLYVVKCSYVGGWVVQKSLKTRLRNIKMAPYKVLFDLGLIL